MNILDRYILRQFFLTTVFALVAFVVIFVVVDMMENLDDFLDANVSAGMTSLYYIYFMPEIIKLMIPVAMLFSSMFTTGKLNTYSELTAMRVGGVSLYRFLFPLFIVAFFISAASVYFNGWIVPRANEKKLAIERKYLGKSLSDEESSNLFFQVGRNRMCSLGHIDEVTRTANRVSIQDFWALDKTVLVQRFDAQTMVWNDTTKVWTMFEGAQRTFKGRNQTIEFFQRKEIAGLTFTPEDIRKKQKKPDEMNYDELGDFIAHQESLGNDVSRWRVDFYGKIAFPFAGVIVVLFGVPFSSVKRKSGLGVEFGIAVAVCFLYMVFLKVSQVFGYNGDISPLLTAWLANIIFFVLAVFNLIRVPK
ncbi:MAG: LPS export ABC transporter permease LptG [Ignavibacteriales bacterium]|nr:LPS export ABC transporter permease LptG [Ignavibacteriales bacterium]